LPTPARHVVASRVARPASEEAAPRVGDLARKKP
jgi:hypothetical protein